MNNLILQSPQLSTSPTSKNISKIILFILIVIIISTISAFIGFKIGQKQITLTSIQTNEIESSNTQNLSWQTYKLPPLRLEFNLPIALNPSGQLKFTTSHNDLFWNDSTNELVKLYSTSINSTFEGGYSYLHGCTGYQITDLGYKFLTYTGTAVDVPIQFVTEITNSNQINYLIVKSNPEQDNTGMPPIGVAEKGNIAALIKTNNEDYPILVMQMKLNETNNESLFNQILSTIRFNP